MNGQVLWYAARAGGIVAWALAAGSVVWGLTLSARALGSRPRAPWLYDLHRFLGGASLVFTVVHVLAVLADSYVAFSLVNLVVPFTGTWHPLAVAWGIVGFYLLLAVELTSLARTRIPKRMWRRVHLASFALFAVSTVHALTAGTDAGWGPFRLSVVAVCCLVALLTAVRVRGQLAAGRSPSPRGARASHPLGAGSAGTPAGTVRRSVRDGAG